MTGGGLEKIEDRYQLVFGQKFEGPYAHGSTTFQVYTSQVRSFDIDYDFAAGTLSYSDIEVAPAGGDPSRFRRRDLNVFQFFHPTIRAAPPRAPLHWLASFTMASVCGLCH